MTPVKAISFHNPAQKIKNKSILNNRKALQHNNTYEATKLYNRP